MTRKCWSVLNDNLRDTVVVFDLDDTLYAEADYRRSGIAHVCGQLEALLGAPFSERLNAAMSAGEADWLACLCRLAELPPAAKESLLWMYRLHSPAIHLSSACAAMLTECERRAKAVLILTDGRVVTQRLKLQALGIAHIPSYISEHHASEKPDQKRFRLIEETHPVSRYVYVADNPNKDFIACNAMGWLSIGAPVHDAAIHSFELDTLPSDALPHRWLENWKDIFSVLC